MLTGKKEALPRMSSGVAVVAETSLKSPRKLFIFIIKEYFLSGESIPKINQLNFEKNFTDEQRHNFQKEIKCFWDSLIRQFFWIIAKLYKFQVALTDTSAKATKTKTLSMSPAAWSVWNKQQYTPVILCSK